MTIYSNQLNSEIVIPFPSEVYTNDQEWWFIYNSETKEIIIEPQQCSGYTSSPFTMIVTNSKEELEQYISENGLFIEFLRFD